MGVNAEHRYIGGSNWRIPGAPFVGGFGGFARVFVTASFACMWTHVIWFCSSLSIPLVGGTESLGITAGETKNPSRNMPRVVKLVFWRCVFQSIAVFYFFFNYLIQNNDILCFDNLTHWAQRYVSMF